MHLKIHNLMMEKKKKKILNQFLHSHQHTHTLTIYYSLSSSQGRAMDMGSKESKNAVYISRMNDQSATNASNYIFGLLQFNYLRLWCILETLNFKMIED